MVSTDMSNNESVIKSWLRRGFGGLFREVFRSASQRALDKRMAAFSDTRVFDNEDMAEHFAHIYLEDIASQNVVKGFIIDRIRFINDVLGVSRIQKESFIDIGDPDGIFIKALGKQGYSANISDMGVRNIHRKGTEAIRCDTEHLPFKDGSIDNILFFEIFEHLPNPVDALKELHRVAGKSVILSIPVVSKTTIHKYNYRPDWPIFEHHIFEFDDVDFRKVISHAGFTVSRHSVSEVLHPVSFKEHVVFLLWNIYQRIIKDDEYYSIRKDLYMGCFKKFSIYYLIKKT